MRDPGALNNGHTAREQSQRAGLISWGSSGKDFTARGRGTHGQPGLATPGLQAGTYLFQRRLRASSVRCTVLASRYACTSLQR